MCGGSASEFTGLCVDVDRVRADNDAKVVDPSTGEPYLRKAGLLIHSGCERLNTSPCPLLPSGKCHSGRHLLNQDRIRQSLKTCYMRTVSNTLANKVSTNGKRE